MQNIPFLLNHIVDHIDDCVIVTNTAGVISHANASALRNFGCDAAQVTALSVNDIIECVHGHGWAEILSEVLRGNDYRGKVHVNYAPTNESFSTLCAFGLRDDTGETTHIVLLLRDITAEQKIAVELEQKNLDMARMNSELLRSNAELKRVSELKSNFLSIASHELKTPLTSIKGYSEIIIENMRGKVAPSVFRMIESISRAADRLHQVINNMLDVTRIEQKRLRLNPERLDLAVVVKDCIEELSQFSSRRTIVFACDFDENLPLFYGDKTRMQQVFTNLFSNALKYSPDNTTVTVRIFIEDNERFHVIVKDAGIGIDKNEQTRIFDPFYEVGSTLRHSSDYSKFLGGGTGLGLSIVRGVVERHGGRIWVQSAGRDENAFPGSEFHFIVPIEAKISWDDNETKLVTMGVLSGQAAERKGAESETPAEPSVKPKILLIDDDTEAVEICKMVLDDAFEVITARSGEAGLQMAFEEKPSLVLLDLYLPGLDGTRICRILRSQEDTHDLPIAFFSAGTQNDEVQQCFASGADDFIVKPFSGKELLNKIWRLLMKKKAEENFR